MNISNSTPKELTGQVFSLFWIPQNSLLAFVNVQQYLFYNSDQHEHTGLSLVCFQNFSYATFPLTNIVPMGHFNSG